MLQDPTLGEVAKILDFGIAKLIQASANQTQSFMGTLAYCSPEQMEGKELDHRSDIYSFGVMMYEMLTMDMPLLPQNSSFGGWYQAHHNFNPEPFNSSLNLPQELQDLVFRCLAKERDDRPQSVREILETLEAIEQTNKPHLTNPNQNITSETQPNLTVDRIEPKSLDDRTLNAESSVTEICLQTPWPEDKPLRKIVFAQLINTHLGEAPVLCVMLDKEDVAKRISSKRYNQFLYLGDPYPMLLWITVIYNPEHGEKWLPCYLDLTSKSNANKGQQITRALAEKGKYRILFYSLDEPQQCQHIASSVIDKRNREKLQEWANMSQTKRSDGDAKRAKQILQQELENRKEKILAKVKASKLTDVNSRK